MNPATSDVGAHVREAMRAVRRDGFLPAAHRDRAALDRPLPLWDGQTNSQPSTVAAMLDLLDVPVGARVLDVGAGSGWTTALLAHLTGPSGRVLGLEIVPSLAEWGAENLDAAGRPWAQLERADPAELGRAADGPYDRILVSAMATVLPQALVDQLAPGGVMVVPVDGRMTRVERPSSDQAPPLVTRHGAYRFVPLRTPEAPAAPAP